MSRSRVAAWWRVYNNNVSSSGGLWFAVPSKRTLCGLRKAAASTIDGLWNAIRDILPRLTSLLECASYFAAAGYKAE